MHAQMILQTKSFRTLINKTYQVLVRINNTYRSTGMFLSYIRPVFHAIAEFNKKTFKFLAIKYFPKNQERKWHY